MSVRARFRDLLESADRVHIDGRVLAYHLLAEPRYLDLTRLLFAGLRSGAIKGQCSVVSVYQLLCEAYRQGEEERAVDVRRFLTVYPGLDMLPVTAPIASQAAQVRAQLGGRTERALQIATALDGGAEIYVTEGSGLRRIAGMRVLDLEDYL